MVLTAVITLHSHHLLPLPVSLFSPVVFSILSVAVIINRLKNLMIDPCAMKLERTIAIALGYAAALPPALLGALAVGAAGPEMVSLTYLVCMAFGTLMTIVCVGWRDVWKLLRA